MVTVSVALVLVGAIFAAIAVIVAGLAWWAAGGRSAIAPLTPEGSGNPSRLSHIAVAVSAVATVAALGWLGVLVLDQLVLFSDQEQTRVAAASRGLMPIPGVVIAASGAVIGYKRSATLGWLVILPAITVIPLSTLFPTIGLQILAYIATAPVALGACLAATMPLTPRGLLAATGAIAVGIALTGYASGLLGMVTASAGALIVGTIWQIRRGASRG
jgi:hypothetical protein